MLKKFVLGGMVVMAALLGNACGDDGSSDSPAAPADSEVTLSSSSDDVVSSSSEKNEAISSSRSTSSSSKKAVGNSSSSNEKSSSSSGKVESSSGKGEKSSSSKKVESSSSTKTEVSSSSTKNNESSSSAKTEESSSSVNTEKSSSSEIVVESSSDVIVEESSSSVQSSSSMNSIYDAVNNTLTDLRDNQVYKTVTIGEQIWMAENLNYMPEDTAGTIFSGATVCGGGEEEIMEDSRKCNILGRLYLRSVALYKQEIFTRQGICPDGWSIPQKKNWEDLITFLGEASDSKMKINDNSMWPNSKHSNESGFSAKPSGNYFTTVGYSHNYNAYFFYWSTQSNPQFISLLDKDDTIIYSHGQPHVMGSVRCIKD